ncbi:MAG: hypothetical protein H6960_11735 [Chromatiaceae bacterium]|nr:hypothetical protein [Chromatiaceae bacterium]
MKLPPQELEAIFDAALANPGWNTPAVPASNGVLRVCENVSSNLDAALNHARAAICMSRTSGVITQLVRY